jgi:hypothetical protein
MTNKGQFVRITEEMIKQRNEHNTEDNKKTCPVKFDLTKVQVFSIDSCIPVLNDEGGRILFVTNVSSISDDEEDEENNTKYSQCPVELRMTRSTMQRILSSLAKEVLTYDRYEKKKTELEENLKKHHQENDILYS